jgi:hypothetical protein
MDFYFVSSLQNDQKSNFYILTNFFKIIAD